eukprot:SAG31_NODE_450_length_15512_cov_5.788555_13_plen_92_part_00
MPIKEEAKRKAATLQEAGTKAFGAKDYETALNCFRKAVAINPQLTQLYVYRSMCNGKLNDWASAEADAKEWCAEQCTIILWPFPTVVVVVW